MVSQLLIALGILLTPMAVLHLTLRRRWVRERAEVPAVLEAEPDILAAEHPTQLAARLNRVRRTEAIHAGYLGHKNIRECDRDSARVHVERSREAAEKIRVAMAAAVKRRVDSGVVTPAMPGVEATSVAGGAHE